MKNFIMILSLVLFSACGQHVTVDPIKVEPFTVNHVVSIDFDKLEAFFLEVCQAQFDPYDPDYASKVNYCKAVKMSEFLTAFSAVSGGT